LFDEEVAGWTQKEETMRVFGIKMDPFIVSVNPLHANEGHENIVCFWSTSVAVPWQLNRLFFLPLKTHVAQKSPKV
jgi:hypothetical protein